MGSTPNRGASFSMGSPDSTTWSLSIISTAAGATKFLDTPLKDLRLKPGMLVAAIAREGKTIIPDGSTSIHAGDKVIVMAKSLFLQDLDEILQE